MGIKLKNNSRFRNMMVVWLILTLLAIIVMSLYPLVQSRMEKREAEQMQASESRMNDFMDMLYEGSVGLYWDYVNSYRDESLTPAELYFSVSGNPAVWQTETAEGNVSSDSEITYSAGLDGYDAEQFNQALENLYREFLRNLVPAYELEYRIYDDQGLGLGNSVNDLFLLSQDDGGGLENRYAFYVALRYDEAGNPSVVSFKGVEERYLNRYISESQDRDRLLNLAGLDLSYYNELRGSRGPANVTIVYASARDTFYMSKDSEEYIMYSAEYRFGDAGFNGIITFALLVTALIGIGLPFVTSEKELMTGIKIPMEILLAGLIVLLMLYEPLASMAYYTVSGSLFSTFLGRAPSTLQNFADYLFNYCVWILYFGSALLLVLSIHPIFREGFGAYVRNCSYCGRLLRGRMTGIRRFFSQLREIDLKDGADRQLLMLLGLNFVVLTVLCCAWVAGILGLFIYTVILFLFLRRRYERIREDYCELLAGVQEMADGNLEVRLPEDLGVFNAMRDELLDIQTGFKKAVEEEIKSQRMRSELITNVSHDLKTPLTSIITYTNLLKEEGITEEQRRAYIDTLDQKSQRLKRLIEDLFVISKASSNNIVLNPVNLDLAALIKQVMFELDDRVKSSQIEFRCSFRPEKLPVYLDCEKTYRIFENLVVNILKYSMPHSRAYITAERMQDEIWVTLKNTSEQELTFQSDEITERFVRGDQSRNTEGSGLGLAIAKSFTTIQGGTFDVVLDGDLFKVILKWKAKEPIIVG